MKQNLVDIIFVLEERKKKKSKFVGCKIYIFMQQEFYLMFQ